MTDREKQEKLFELLKAAKSLAKLLQEAEDPAEPLSGWFPRSTGESISWAKDDAESVVSNLRRALLWDISENGLLVDLDMQDLVS